MAVTPDPITHEPPAEEIRADGVPFGLCFRLGRLGKQHMHMTMEGADVSEGGEIVGSVCAIVPSGVQITDKARGETWHLTATDIWRAYRTAREGHTPPIDPAAEVSP